MLPHIHKHNTHIHMEKDQYLVLKSQKVEPFDLLDSLRLFTIVVSCLDLDLVDEYI